MMSAVSIGIAVYNIKEEFLRECIESVINQKFCDIEIIIVDDGSQNGADKICREYADKDSRIQFIGLEKNAGVSNARNIILSRATGRWLCFLDADDIFSDKYLQNTEAFVDSDYDIVLFDYTTFSKKTPTFEPITDKCIPNELDGAKIEEICVSCLTGVPVENFGINLMTGAMGKIFRRDFLTANDAKFICGLKKSEDSLFCARLFHQSKKVAFIPYTAYYYRMNPESVCNRLNTGFKAITDAYLEHCAKNVEEMFGGRADVLGLFKRYKITNAVIDNLKLNIFHKDNPKGFFERRKEFRSFLEDEPYKTALTEIDLKNYAWKDRKLILSLAKKKRFFALDFTYKHPWVFRLYGGITSRIDRLKIKAGR